MHTRTLKYTIHSHKSEMLTINHTHTLHSYRSCMHTSNHTHTIYSHRSCMHTYDHNYTIYLHKKTQLHNIYTQNQIKRNKTQKYITVCSKDR